MRWLFRNLTKGIDDNAEIYFDKTELPLWYLSHRKRKGMPDLVMLHDKNSIFPTNRYPIDYWNLVRSKTIDLQEEVTSACRYLGKDAAFRYLEDRGLTKREIEEWMNRL